MVSACPCMPHADLTIVASATKRYDRGLCGETLNPLSRQASETTNENTRAGPSADIVAQDHTSDDTTTSFRAARVSLDAEEGALIISHLRGRIPEIGADDIWDNATHAELRCNLANAGESGCGGAPACDNVGQCTQKTMKCTRTKWTECRGCFRGAPGCPGGYHCHAGAWPSPTDGHVHQGGGAFCNWACCVRIGTKDFTRNCPKTGCCKSFQCPSGWTRNGLDPDGDANKDKCCTPLHRHRLTATASTRRRLRLRWRLWLQRGRGRGRCWWWMCVLVSQLHCYLRVHQDEEEGYSVANSNGNARRCHARRGYGTNNPAANSLPGTAGRRARCSSYAVLREVTRMFDVLSV